MSVAVSLSLLLPSTLPLLVALSLPTAPPLPAKGADLRTVAEQSGFSRTGRYDEVVSLCERFAQTFPSQVRCQRFGVTPQGRPMLALVASTDGTFEPESIRRQARPVVLVQGCVHAGEVDGKDAGLWLLRSLLTGEVLPGLLSKLTLVFVPVFNVDGHERFAAHQRPNQNGPVETGWRVNAQNLNLNRDFAKAETTELQAMLGLLGRFDPLLYVDLHVTDGADFQPDLAVQIEPRLGGPAPLRAIGSELSQRVLDELRRGGHLPLDFYPSFIKKDDPSSGFVAEVPPPRFSTGYWSRKNRFAVLVETHSWKPYPQRVKTTYDALVALLRGVGERGTVWQKAALDTDRTDEKRPPGSVYPLVYDTGPTPVELRFPGYAYKLEPSRVSGGLRTSYDPTRPEVWKIPFFPTVVEKHPIKLPAAYVVPPEHAGWLTAKLRVHGLTYSTLSEPLSGPCSVYRVRNRTFGEAPYEGRQTVRVEGEWHRESCSMAPGGLLIPVAQRGGGLVAQLLEPEGPDSLLQWGFFNAIFEQKEYLEDYVAEQVAEQLLASDGELRRQFAKLLEQPAFASSPAARLAFFAARHPSHDRSLNRYPILRLDSLPPAGSKPVATGGDRYGGLLQVGPSEAVAAQQRRHDHE
jgi:hypothetical protein